MDKKPNPRTGMSAALRTMLGDAEDSMTRREISTALEAQGIRFTADSLSAQLRQYHAAGEYSRAEINGHLAYTLNPGFVPAPRGRKPRTGWSEHFTDPAPKSPRPAIPVAKVLAAPVVAIRDVAPTVVPAMAEAPPVDPVEFQRLPAPEIDARLQVEQNTAEAVAAVPAAAPALRQAIKRALADGSASSLNEIVGELGRTWTRRQVLAAISDGLLSGWLQSANGPEGEASVFALAGDLLTNVLPMAEALPPMDPVHYAADAHELRAPLGLRDRVEAIASDIEDAIGDACDARLAHELIKALTVANGATQRALRQLAA